MNGPSDVSGGENLSYGKKKERKTFAPRRRFFSLKDPTRKVKEMLPSHAGEFPENLCTESYKLSGGVTEEAGQADVTQIKTNV